MLARDGAFFATYDVDSVHRPLRSRRDRSLATAGAIMVKGCVAIAAEAAYG
jgi:hypothetical protein